jgi:hypothetical protein
MDLMGGEPRGHSEKERNETDEDQGGSNENVFLLWDRPKQERDREYLQGHHQQCDVTERFFFVLELSSEHTLTSVRTMNGMAHSDKMDKWKWV